MLDPKAIEQMKKLSMAFDDIDNGVKPQRQTSLESGDDPYASQKVMENILSKLSNIEGFDYDKRDYTELKANSEFNQNTRHIDQYDADQRLANIYGNPDMYQDSYIEGEIPKDIMAESDLYVLESNIISNKNVLKKPSTPWNIISEDVKGLKNVKKYGIQSSYNNQVIIEGIMMQEAVNALLNILNDGGTLTNPKVLGIISYGIQYTNVLENALKHIKERQKVLNESKYNEAMELDVKISESKNEAAKLKKVIIEYIAKSKL